MKKVLLKTLGLIGATAAVLFMASDVALAQDMSSVLQRVKGQMPDVAEILSAFSYIIGIGFGIKAALKFKEYNESKGRDAHLSQPITLIVVAAILLALPTFLTTGRNTIFGNGTTNTTIDGAAMRAIN